MRPARRRAARVAQIVRVALAALVFAAAAFGSLAAGEAAGLALKAVASWQLFPAADRAIGAALVGFGAEGLAACAAASAAAAAILAGSALFGRWYCAALCPLGTFQDLASLLRRRKRAYRKALHPLRAAALVAALALAVAGAMSLASWLDPWSLFARFFTYDVQVLARLARREDLPGLSAVTVVASGVALLSVLAASFLSGRFFCGNICPVGSLLGLLSARAPLRVRLDRATCVSCGACASVCRASCIDAEGKSLDATRCVNCMACLAACPTGALRYGPRKRAETRTAALPKTMKDCPASSEALAASPAGLSQGLSRAFFLAAVGNGIIALSAAALLRRASPGRLAGLVPAAPDSIGDSPRPPVLPPGARSLESFLGSCVGCGICVGRCPSKVLQPALRELGLAGHMAPRLDHSISYCQYDCKACLDICPSGALEKLSLAEKRLTKIGDASLVKSRCVVFTNRTKCGACAEHCPTGAVRMVVGETGLPEPLFTSSICIGCGACHHACPVRPERAISVSGLAAQSLADAPSPHLFDTQGAKGVIGEAGEAGKLPPGDSGGEGEFPF